MRERPILFSGPMVRAILEGRKTQTRRVLARSNSTTDGYSWPAHAWSTLDFAAPCFVDGAAGGITVMGNGEYLKVPRSLCDCGCSFGDTRHRVRCRTEPGDRLWVKETHAVNGKGTTLYRADFSAAFPLPPKWKPSIFMPRALSRITLEVTEVRVQRVQDISEEDAVAEGRCLSPGDPRGYFPETWDSINAKRGFGWDTNPWVWAITFKPMTAPRRGVGE